MAEHVRLRAPGEHGQTLQRPPLADGPAILAANQKILSGYPAELQTIRLVARHEFPQMALEYTQQYSDVSATPDSDSIVMSGHQPTLFHPGVWFKNFALDSLRRSCNATAINLVVDNDVCDDTSVLVPEIDAEGKAGLVRVLFDEADVAVPFEMRQTKEITTFHSFPRHVLRLLRKVADEKPLVGPMWWHEVFESDESLNLPAAIAAIRHRLEQKHDLRNLELPVSHVSTSQSFSMFVELIVLQAKRFAEIYNASLIEYRRANRIRSRSHPVPELETDGRWQEIPFWVWTEETLNGSPSTVTPVLTRGLSSCLIEDNGPWCLAVTVLQIRFKELNQLNTDAFIRPRALATTMFSRLFASDLFLHGIGGAKYDQLNDEIMRRFFGIAVPPAFMTSDRNVEAASWNLNAVTKQMVTRT